MSPLKKTVIFGRKFKKMEANKVRMVGYWNSKYFINNEKDYLKFCRFHQNYFNIYRRIINTKTKSITDLKEVSYMVDLHYKGSLKKIASIKWQDKESFETAVNMIKAHNKRVLVFLYHIKKQILKKQKTVG